MSFWKKLTASSTPSGTTKKIASATLSGATLTKGRRLRAGAVAHRVFGPNKEDKDGAGPACRPRPSSNETAQAVCSSDHFLSRNWWLSINVFQHAMLPKRLENEPPSRTCPAFSIRVP